jgi:hypothetical protein
MHPAATRQQLLERAAQVSLLLGALRREADRGELKRALTESHGLLEEARRWLSASELRLDRLGHPPGLAQVPALAEQMRRHLDELGQMLPLLGFAAAAVDLATDPMLAVARDAAEGVVAAVQRLQGVLETTDLDAIEAEARAAFDRAFGTLAATPELELDADDEGQVLPYDSVLSELDRA